MQERDRVAEFPQMPALHKPLGQRLGSQLRVGREHARDELAQRVLRESGGGRIDGCQPVGQSRAEIDNGELRMDDLAAEVTLAHFAEHAYATPNRKRFLLVRVEMKKTQYELRAVAGLVGAIFQQADELASRPVLDIDPDYGPFGLLLAARLECRERNEASVILVAQRQVQDEIRLARDAEPRELVGKRRARRLAWLARGSLACHSLYVIPAQLPN